MMGRFRRVGGAWLLVLVCVLWGCESEGGSDGGGGSSGSSEGGAAAASPEKCESDPCDFTLGASGTVNCDDVSCELDGHACCSAGPGAPISCSEGTTCDDEIRATCDGPEDCGASEECCFRLATLADATIACTPAGTCTGDALNMVFCHADADCEGDLTCKMFDMMPWVGSCGWTKIHD